MAVVRLKRNFDEEPIESLLLACKRRKTEEDHLTSIFKFAATVTDQKENVSKHISKAFSLFNTKSHTKSHNISNITDKLRAENKLFSQNNRLKVVNCFRELSTTENIENSEDVSSSNLSLTIVDIESLPATSSETSQSSTSSVAGSESASQKYVYDIYFAPDCNLDDKILSNPMSCHPLDNLVFEDYSNDAYDVEEESDDSNDENNWRNDYPDEDPDSIGEDQMKMACQMGGLTISETNSLSSDDGEENFVYGIEEPDVDYFGCSYAAYKKRVVKDLDSDASENSDFYFCDSDLESDSAIK